MAGAENSLSYSKLEQAAVIKATAEKDEGAHRTKSVERMLIRDHSSTEEAKLKRI